MMYFLFFLSGAAALIYEILWSKYLILLLGSTLQAQTMVLAIFMLGLAMGNRAFGKRSDRIESPLKGYGMLELGIGMYGLAFPFLYDGMDFLFVKMGRPLLAHPGSFFFIKAFLCCLLLLPPTFLMGGTLPLMIAWVSRSRTHSASWTARLYALNSLGAVLGAFAAGFFLIEYFGMSLTLWMTGWLNLFIAVLALLYARPVKNGQPSGSNSPSTFIPPLSISESSRSNWLVFFTGALSLGMELLAARALILIYGASSQSFSVVLCSFILGITLAGAWVSRTYFGKQNAARWSVLFLTFCALHLLFLAAWMEPLIRLYIVAASGVSLSLMGYRYLLLIQSLFAGVALGIPAFLLGCILPLWMRQESIRNQGWVSGQLLSWNTLGSVCGVILTGFWILPHLGLFHSLLVFSALLSLLALGVALQHRKFRWAIVGVSALVMTGSLSIRDSGDWRYLISGGLFRISYPKLSQVTSAYYKSHFQLLFYRDGSDATVSVEKNLSRGSKGNISLRINGKVDASTDGDLSTQFLLAHLPMIHFPDKGDVFILGFGSGITAGALLGHPVGSITIAENCAPVLQAADHFKPWNRDVIHHPKVRVLNEDARTLLKLDPKKYDVIISEPSNPWMIGVGNVFTAEFFELASSRLKPGGVMAQWFHLYEMDDSIVKMVIRTFQAVFPETEIWDSQRGDIIILGSQKPWKSDRNAYQKLWTHPEVATDLKRIGIDSPELLWARQIASQNTAYAIPGGGDFQLDESPSLEFRAPLSFFLRNTSKGLFEFDERTWESNFIPAEKRLALSSLPREKLESLFSLYASSNPYLNDYYQKGTRETWSAGSLPLPLVFVRTPYLSRVQYLPSDTQDPRLQTLLHLEDQWAAGKLNDRQACDQIEQVLDSLINLPEVEKIVWPPSYFASLAVKACILNNDNDRAWRFIRKGLQLQPESSQLLYLARVLFRIAPPTHRDTP